jgi:hypothetical protein
MLNIDSVLQLSLQNFVVSCVFTSQIISFYLSIHSVISGLKTPNRTLLSFVREIFFAAAASCFSWMKMTHSSCIIGWTGCTHMCTLGFTPSLEFWVEKNNWKLNAFLLEPRCRRNTSTRCDHFLVKILQPIGISAELGKNMNILHSNWKFCMSCHL